MSTQHPMPPLDKPSSLTPKGRIVLFLKGMAMGVADSVPGVSGGTIAVMAGIYEELLNSIKSVNPGALVILFRQGPGAFWSHINGTFLAILFIGILTSLFLSANTVLYLLDNHYPLLMAFFCGLVLASTRFLWGQVQCWNIACVLSALLGSGITLLVALANPVSGSSDLVYLFLCGFIAICAMILPGISGAFILLLLGVYDSVLGALRSLDFLVIVVFASGCASGLLSFSHLLSWTFTRYREATYSFLTGMLATSLIVLWPWKNTASEISGLDAYLSPGQFVALSGQDANVVLAVVLLLLGFALIHLFERFSINSPA
jgi:putative membrane protein